MGDGNCRCNRFHKKSLKTAANGAICCVESRARHPAPSSTPAFPAPSENTMSDPYNSAGSQFAAAAAVAAPARPPAIAYDPIARLDVSDTWKKRFREIESAGGASTTNFNLLAFLFGPFYYVAKGLWRQAIVYTLIAIAIVLVIDAMSGGRFTGGIGTGVGFVYSMRANISYYRLVVLGEKPYF
jgi:hypothetical protein